MTNLRILSIIAILAFCLAGCNSTSSFLNKFSDKAAVSDEKGEEQELQIAKVLNDFFAQIFDAKINSSDETTAQQMERVELDKNPKFEEFNSSNTLTNVRLSIDKNPKVAARIGKLKSYQAEIAAFNSVKALTSDVQAVGGLQTEDRDTEAAATVILSTNKLLYDAKSADLRIESKNYQLKSGQVAILVSADLVALEGLRAWIDLIRYQQVMGIFTDGFAKTRPLLEQIESISTSGLTDKKLLLAAQRQVMELQDQFLNAQSLHKISEQVFLDSFPNVDLRTVVEKPHIDLNDTDLLDSFDLDQTPSVLEKKLLVKALETNILGLQASEKPQISFRASVNAPLQDTLDDGTANAGLSLNYKFNDGGALAAAIDQVYAELEILKSEIKVLQRTLKMDYEKQSIKYNTLKERRLALQTLISVSEEILETARQQLLSGRSTVKDILDAEVSLSSLKIDQVNANADSLIALLTIKAYKDGLTQVIDWSY